MGGSGRHAADGGGEPDGGRQIDACSAPQLVAILNELSQRAAIPTPRLYVVDSPGANASAAGRDRRHASICVTTGLLHSRPTSLPACSLTSSPMCANDSR